MSKWAINDTPSQEPPRRVTPPAAQPRQVRQAQVNKRPIPQSTNQFQPRRTVRSDNPHRRSIEWYNDPHYQHTPGGGVDGNTLYRRSYEELTPDEKIRVLEKTLQEQDEQLQFYRAAHDENSNSYHGDTGGDPDNPDSHSQVDDDSNDVDGKKSKGKKKNWFTRTLAYLIIIAAFATGGYFLWDGLNGEVIEETPLPPGEVVFDPQAGPQGPDGMETIPLENSDPNAGADVDASLRGQVNAITQSATMSVGDMANLSVFIPAIGSYAPLVTSGTFVPSDYSGFDTLEIPPNPRSGVWYDNGVPLVGGNQGTTLVGSHVSYGNIRGAFYNFYQLGGGETVWTKDGNGNTQKWVVTRVWNTDHKSFPQEYFSPEGERQLVLTTCGGRVNAQGYYRDNIFVIAKPV